MDLSALYKVVSPKNLRFFFAAAGIAVALFFSYTRVFESYELQTYDWRFSLRGERPVSTDIVLIDVWDDTLAALAQYAEFETESDE